MNIETIAKVAHQINKAYCESIGDDSQPDWANAPDWQKESAMAGVEFHLANPNASPKDSHDSWLAGKKGWKYGPVKDEKKKLHPCLLPYEQLPVAMKTKDYLFRCIVTELALLDS